MNDDKRQTTVYNILGAIATHAVRLETLADAMSNIVLLKDYYMNLHDEDKKTHEEEIENLFDKLGVIVEDMNDLSTEIREKAYATRKSMKGLSLAIREETEVTRKSMKDVWL
ncbi:hypothetical protein [Hydrogenimonas urashimensis]|uniref:hypothetical protein n=1 Tax=Hydrogenimonas urashimensis TaxID=2740515 RepID=UPI001916682C|nr:hypothetical protein [Hydrogenimonas urashimensis]